MGARVPQELADTIVDTLHDNTHALTQCSLVCRAWVSSTRYHLFSHVDLAYEKKLSPFLEILAADLCTVIPFVKEITMRRYDFAMRPTVSGGLEVATSTLLQHLSYVVSMHLYHFTSLDIPFFADLLPRFPMLAQLELVLMECDSLSRLCRLLDGCTALTSLRMDRVAWPPANAEPSTYLRACSIRTLCLDAKASILDAFMRGTRDEPEGLSCTTLLLSNITPDSVQSVQRFLRCIGSSLEDLSLTYEWVMPGGGSPRVLAAPPASQHAPGSPPPRIQGPRCADSNVHHCSSFLNFFVPYGEHRNYFPDPLASTP
ncbi:hypothetical protein C8J57DRAFT_369475 [Mycena rebaudengoi]|nr:hypothetical protein C8J57DRAFT_369475 [Mycena rebaudengoi]